MTTRISDGVRVCVGDSHSLLLYSFSGTYVFGSGVHYSRSLRNRRTIFIHCGWSPLEYATFLLDGGSCYERREICCEMAEEDSRRFAALCERFVKLQQPYTDVIS